MLYAVYGEDGKITQANKVYIGEDEHAKYQELLSDLGHKWVSQNTHDIPMSEHWYVKVSQGELCERPVMDIKVNKTVFKCGSNDALVFKGCIKGSAFECIAAGEVIYSGILDGEELELHSVIPCLWKVKFNYWPFKQYEFVAEAVA
jgi:hypothetical protein